MHPVILDKATDDIFVRRHKAMLRRYLDDYLDLAETQPALIKEWNASSATNIYGQWRGEEDAVEGERFWIAARDHYLGRHPVCTSADVDNAHASYMAFIRGWGVEEAAA